MKIKTASDLKFLHELKHPKSHFFSRETMKFFGDSMKNYGIKHYRGHIELIRKKPVKHGLTDSAFFDLVTFALCPNPELSRIK